MVDILMPLEQEGSVAQVTRWLKTVGDSVATDEAIVELETDKVSVEIGAPCAGVLTHILMDEGTQAEPGAVLGQIGEAEGASPVAPIVTVAPTPSAAPAVQSDTRHSPAVRKALAETGLDPASLTGTGRDGRLTRADVLRAAKMPTPAPEEPAPRPAPASPPISATAGESHSVPHDAMRFAIARNMTRSLQEAPQVTAVFEADFSAIARHRAAHKADFADQGISLSYTSYILAAAARAMQEVPQLNSRWHEDRLEYFRDVNIGVGTALGDKGLVVPVLRRVQDLSLRGIAAGLQDMTLRAREGRLTRADLQGGTFTLSNHGVSGSLLAAPIILHDGQAGILGIGKLEKRVVVREIDGSDAMVIRPMAYVTLTIDHRILDGATSNAWLTSFVATLENWEEPPKSVLSHS